DTHRELIIQFCRCCLPEKTATFASHVIGHVDSFLYFTACFFQHFAVFQRQQLCQSFLSIIHHARNCIQDFPAYRRWRQCPVFLCSPGSFHCIVHIFRTGQWHFHHRFSVCRIHHLTVIIRIHPFTVDIV